ncbi:hypothetical protein C0993_007330 [Termitomyces sp. T159_Od127]|nr:hypothetical protein C0993_007330 [Termitomyces sp. T159_Od127]
MVLLSPLYNKPNRIIEKQRLYQNDPRKIMYRLPRSGLYLGIYGALFTASSIGTVYGIYSLIRGKTE